MWKSKHSGARARICVDDLENMNEDFFVNFDEDTLKHFQAIGKRIELISEFKKKTR